ncbi:flagellar biosynthesis protein FliQ [Garciella nitratireducens]|uniref:Flagellar biosynthetic protein FliQ n=1 Tax=Garciella nitratireducens DSM 15102 TaxID=1121911 RepID=A0A1T4LD69_9FIRM|nr:flagellar biosynthesis protein FliQ [Garciella nitratireducens]RBP46751.1 flagellar biosynthetic protein FliQ [Garciella nitratireducens]SJZ52571.1 flagellar biosynthetic protein FliQ [Garciella nitratireducens DSM 15102]
MSEAVVLDIMKNALTTALKIGAPVLVISLAVGLVISILQATTQIQEQTLTFVPKIIAVFLSLIIFGSFMLNTLISFTNRIFDYIANMI